MLFNLIQLKIESTIYTVQYKKYNKTTLLQVKRQQAIYCELVELNILTKSQ